MFANYDYTEFPEVKVTFDGSINNVKSFSLFIIDIPMLDPEFAGLIIKGSPQQFEAFSKS